MISSQRCATTKAERAGNGIRDAVRVYSMTTLGELTTLARLTTSGVSNAATERVPEAIDDAATGNLTLEVVRAKVRNSVATPPRSQLHAVPLASRWLGRRLMLVPNSRTPARTGCIRIPFRDTETVQYAPINSSSAGTVGDTSVMMFDDKRSDHIDNAIIGYRKDH